MGTLDELKQREFEARQEVTKMLTALDIRLDELRTKIAASPDGPDKTYAETELAAYTWQEAGIKFDCKMRGWL